MRLLRTEPTRLRHVSRSFHSSDFPHTYFVKIRPVHILSKGPSSLQEQFSLTQYALKFRQGTRNAGTISRVKTRCYFFVRHYSSAQSAAINHDRGQSHELVSQILRGDSVSSARDEGVRESPTGNTQSHAVLGSVPITETPPLNINLLRDRLPENELDPVHVLCPNVFASILRRFLGSEQRLLPLRICENSSDLVSTLAKELNLWLWRFAHTSAQTSHHFYLVKKDDASYTAAQADVFSTDFTSSFADDALDDLQTSLREGDYHILSSFTNDHHWPLLLNCCQHNAEAIPSLLVRLQDEEGEIRAEDLSSKAAVRELIVCSKNHGNPIAVNSDNVPDGDRMTQFAQLICSYLRKLREQTASKQLIGLRFGAGLLPPGEFMQQAASTLGFGPIKYGQELVPAISDTDGVRCWRSEIKFGKRPNIKISAVWLGRKPARLICTVRACIALKTALEEAYRAGEISRKEYQPFAKHWGEEISVRSDLEETRGLIREKRLTFAISVADDTIARMLDALRELREKKFIQLDRDLFDPEIYKRQSKAPRGLSRRTWLDLKLQRDRKQSKHTPGSGRRLLPLLQQNISSKILTTIEANDFTIITAATGSGKTTQIPQLIWDQHITNRKGSVCNIVCTQPRRVSTIAVAKRVASERHQQLGIDVGYSVRFDDQPPIGGCGINYMTSGLLLRMLEGDCSRVLASLSHLIIDEVHNRDSDTDLILTALKNQVNRLTKERWKLPKIVLMSATIDAEYFADYFKDTDMPIKVASINVPGSSYPVSTYRLRETLSFLEKQRPNEIAALVQKKEMASYIASQYSPSSDSENVQPDMSHVDASEDLITSNVDRFDDLYVPIRLIPFIIDHILKTSKSGDILVFLPGFGEIEDTEELLKRNALDHDFNDPKSYQIFKLHSSLYETNMDVFNSVPPGCRRIVLATNIAETSLTLPDVKFVIDTGLSRQSFYEQATQSGQLRLVWISKTEVTQRRGRVGRTQPGDYFALYSNEHYENMVERPQPELTRTSLSQIALRVQESPAFQVLSYPKSPVGDANTTDPGIVLLTAPSPPSRQKIIAAGHQLRNLKAVTEAGRVTALGKALSVMPCNPAPAKAILLGTIFRCLDPLIFFGAQLIDCQIMTNAESPGAVAAIRKTLAKTTNDDNLADAKAFFDYDNARRSGNTALMRSMRSDMFLRHDTYREVSQTSNQIVQTLKPVHNLGENSPEQWTNIPYLFPITSPSLNTNKSNHDLIKALSLSTAGTKLGFWGRRDWLALTHPRMLPSPRSVNHTSTRKAVREQRMKREDGDILAYGVLRILPRDKYPWACETSCVSPISGILFAESVRLVDGNKLMINDWVSYEITTPTGDPNTAAKIIMEYRKALDRFLNMALDKISLHPNRLKKVVKREMKTDDFNIYLRDEDHPHRKIIVDSVIDILAIEAKARADRLEIKRLDEAEISEATTATAVMTEAAIGSDSDSMSGPILPVDGTAEAAAETT